MSLDKLGIIFLLNYLNQLGSVKDHVVLAIKEILLAVQATIDLVGKSASQKVLGSSSELLQPILKRVNGVLQYTIDKVAPPQQGPVLSGEDGLRLKENIVDSIISAIDEEIENTRNVHDEIGKLKVEALATVKKVLLNQKKKPLNPPVEVKKTIKSAHVA